MKIVFMGTPDFAVPSLHALTEAGYEVAAVVTQPDKPKGRGKTLLLHMDRLFQKKSWNFRNLDVLIFMRLFFRNTEEQLLSSRL